MLKDIKDCFWPNLQTCRSKISEAPDLREKSNWNYRLHRSEILDSLVPNQPRRSPAFLVPPPQDLCLQRALKRILPLGRLRPRRTNSRHPGAEREGWARPGRAQVRNCWAWSTPWVIISHHQQQWTMMLSSQAFPSLK